MSRAERNDECLVLNGGSSVYVYEDAEERRKSHWYLQK